MTRMDWVNRAENHTKVVKYHQKMAKRYTIAAEKAIERGDMKRARKWLETAEAYNRNVEDGLLFIDLLMKKANE